MSVANTSKSEPGRPSFALPSTAGTTVLCAYSTCARSVDPAWGDDGHYASGLEWISPAPNDAFISGGKLVATWSMPSAHIVSPSFQLCLVEMGECGDTVWPNVKKLPNNQYTITMKIPDLGLDNEFFIRMEDNHGRVYDTPEFKLQATSTDSQIGNKDSSSVLPNSLADPNTPGIPIIDPQGSNSGSPDSSSEGKSSSPPWRADGDDEHRPQADNESKESPMRASGNGPNNSNSTMPNIGTSINATLSAATSSASSLAPAPLVTNNTLAGTSGGNKPSTAAIVVPLALFAAALVGLIFSLRQRSKSKDNQARTQTPSNVGREEPTLKQVITRESFVGGSSGNSGTDLERAMEFITRVQAVDSPRLTQLPADIEAKRRVRRERRMREARQTSGVEDRLREMAAVPVSSSAPNLQQHARQDIPTVVLGPAHRAYSSTPSDVTSLEAPQTAPYVVHQGNPPGIPQISVYRLPPTPRTGPLPAINHLPYVMPARSNPPPAMVTPPAAGFPLANMPRPPLFAQQQALSVSTSLPALMPIDPRHNLHSVPATVLVEGQLTSGHPSSLQVAQPQVPTAPPPRVVRQCEAPFPHPHAQDMQPQSQFTPSASLATGPEIPHSTRPQPQPQPQAYGMPNPYEAIVKALGTPRLG